MRKIQFSSTRQDIQKCGLIMDSLCFRLTTVFYIILITNSIFIESTPLPNMCLTPTCVQAAADILRKMDSNVDPCDNFYKFACGQFINSTFTPPSVGEIFWQTVVNHDTFEKLGLIFESEITKDEIKPFRQAKHFYKQCMNRTDMMKQKDKIILETLNELGGWPVIMGDKWNSTDMDWIKIPGMLVKMGYLRNSNSFLHLSFESSNNKSMKYMIRLRPTSEPKLGSKTDAFNNTRNIKIYNSLVEYAVELGADKERAKQEIMESMKFEINLANISSAAIDEISKNESMLDINMTINEMIKKWPTIDWLTYINGIFSISPDIKKVDKNETVIITLSNYITKLEKLINSTPKRVLVNYVLTQVVATTLKIIHYNTEVIYDAAQPVNYDSVHWKMCIKDTLGFLPQVVNALYIQNYIDYNVKIETMNIASNIKKELIKMMNEVEWLDGEMKDNLIKKIQYMNSKIGYSDIYRDVKNITEKFHDLQLNGPTFLHDSLAMSRLNIISDLKMKRNKITLDDNEFWITVNEANAFYDPDYNIFSVSPLLLQHPFMDDKQPAYMNYGGIGYIIGHELIHAIDNSGRLFDKNGTKQENWWKKSSEKIFLDKVQCLINQYNNYTITESKLKMNGTLTLNENISDNVGGKLSYLAYKNWSSRHGPEPKLPALDYNPSQMFWISMANVWCSKSREAVMRDVIKFEPHSLPEFRILGTLSNIPEFSEDFNCPLGSPMNPKKKCKVW